MPLGGCVRRWALVALAVPTALTAQTQAKASATGLPASLATYAGTPLGALPPAAPAMPTSRDDTLLVGVRLQYAARALPAGHHLTSYGVGTDVQIQGRTILSGLVGYQSADAGLCVVTGCKDHRVMAAVRFISNMVTTRPFVHVPFFGGNSATGSAGLEIGGGWGGKAFDENQHWSADVSVPLSLSVGQRIRVEPFAAPALAAAWGSSSRGWRYKQRFLTGGGIGLQEIGQLIGVRGLDLTVSVQRLFDPHGTAVGITASWIHLPGPSPN